LREKDSTKTRIQPLFEHIGINIEKLEKLFEMIAKNKHPISMLWKHRSLDCTLIEFFIAFTKWKQGLLEGSFMEDSIVSSYFEFL
jgi:hypothetical protein